MHYSAIESLESRIAPAVAMVLVDGVLNITGEFTNVRLDIDHTASNTVVKDNSSTLGTFTDVQSIVIKLEGEGLVDADFAPQSLAGDFKFKSLGKLNLQFNASSEIGGNLKILGNTTDESVSFGAGCEVDGNITMKTGGGSDIIGFSNGGIYRGNVFLDMGDGDNTFNIQSGTLEKNFTLIQGAGWDVFSYGIAGTTSIAGTLSVSQGGGNDRIQTFGGGLAVGEDFIYRGGGGNDRFIVSSTVQGELIDLAMGGGNDLVSFDGSAPNAAVKINMEGGDDTLAGSLWTFGNPKRVNFDGGTGNDELIEPIATIQGDPKKIRNFETTS